MIRLLFAALAVTLSACSNQVYSRGPLFTPEPIAAILRPGVWAAPDQACRFDPAQPLAAWPDCAHGQAIEQGQALWEAKSARLTLAAGEPMILQLQAARRPRETWYYALAPLRRDQAGRVVELETWAVLCGPPPPPRIEADGDSHEDSVTHHPLPGLHVSGRNCLARRPDPIRDAARLSRGWDDDPTRAYWVRDGAR
ncbi:hypothetical protein [Phenylobacterium sp.]|uniref:hypothetical protein n=1 Tax=Phenylobacterium sp. TaxID=1871053 RepID=UPI002FE2BADF